MDKWKQTIRELTIKGIEELSRNGGRVVQVISQRQASLDYLITYFLCLVEEREDNKNEQHN